MSGISSSGRGAASTEGTFGTRWTHARYVIPRERRSLDRGISWHHRELPLASTNHFLPAKVGLQGGGNEDCSVGLLVVLQEGDDGATHR